ncbi:MAG: mechanosensitive ion channel family protein [Synechococcus sp.]
MTFLRKTNGRWLAIAIAIGLTLWFAFLPIGHRDVTFATVWVQTAIEETDSAVTDAGELIDWTEYETSPVSDESNDREGWLVLGSEPLFQLQGFGSLTAADRANLVMSKIEDFLEPNEEGHIPRPRIDVELVADREYILRLFDRNKPALEPVVLFTVTHKDAARYLELEVDRSSVSQTRVVAQQWAKLLEPAINVERDRLIAIQQTRQPILLARNILSFVAIVAVAIGLAYCSDRAIHHLQSLEQKHPSPVWRLWFDTGTGLGKWAIRLGIAVGAVHLSMKLLPILAPFQKEFYRRLQATVEVVWNVLKRPLLPNTQVSIVSVIAFAIFAIAIFTLARNLSETLKLKFLSRFRLEVGNRESIATLTQYVLTVLGVLLVLPLIGIDFSSLALVAGALSLGIGIGLQNLTNNFISGILMLFERPIQVGDFVEVDDLIGTVEQVSLRSTIIRTLDSVNVIVPNSRFMESNVISWTYRDSSYRLHVPVGVAYGSDTKKVREVLLSIAHNHQKILKSPAPQVQFVGLGDSSLNFDLLVWSIRPAERFILKSDLYFEIEERLHEHNIEIPFPQRDLHIRTPGKLANLLQPVTKDSTNSSKGNPIYSEEPTNAKDPEPF